MNRELLQQALDALKLVAPYTDYLTCYASTMDEHKANLVDPTIQSTIAAIQAELAKPEQEEVSVRIGVDVTASGTYVVAFNCRANLARECFYAEWHPLAKPTNEFHPDWDTLKPYHDRIAELEAQLAKPEYSDLRKAAEMALEALEMHVLGFDGVRKMELAIEALESALAKPDETETLKRCLFQMQEAAKALAQPEQDHGFDRTANHMAGEYVDTAQSKAMHEACIEASMRNTQPEQEPVKKALRLKPHECICGYSVGHPLVPKCICKPEYTAQPEHPLDKKADNARELGLDYELEQSILICSNCGADRAKEDCKGERTYCPFAGHAQQDHGFDRTASHMAGEYMDTAPPKQWVGLTDDEILSFVAFEPHPLMNKTSIIHAVQAKLREKNG